MTARENSFSRKNQFAVIIGLIFLATVVSISKNARDNASFTSAGQDNIAFIKSTHSKNVYIEDESKLNGVIDGAYTPASVRIKGGHGIEPSAANNQPNTRQCFRARNNTVPLTSYSKLSKPIINLGMPKMGSSSIHSFFGCGGYATVHYRCTSSASCAECIRASVDDGLPPLSKCGAADVYSQIDASKNGVYYFPQIELLEEFVRDYPNATFVLPFRSMEKWFQSVKNWNGMKSRFTKSNITGLPVGVGKTVDELSDWFCWHVERVRGIVAQNPSHTLVEIDIEDPGIGHRLGDIFGVDATCWGRANINTKIHSELNETSDHSITSDKVPWFIKDGLSPVGKLVFNVSGKDEGNETIVINNQPNTRQCFRARNNTVPLSLHNKLPLPIINLGMPKMGSSSIHSFFGCGGYATMHYQCSRTESCAECIRSSVDAGLPPLSKCGIADVYTQIDASKNGVYYFPQIELLEEFVRDYPSATFVFPFRSMEKWFQSVKNWNDMKSRFTKSNITGLPVGVGKTVDELSNWFCWHVERVRDIVAQNPSHTLVEIDIEDPGVGHRLGDIFGVDASCWGRANTNAKIHPELSHADKLPWFIKDGLSLKGKLVFNVSKVENNGGQ